MYKEEIFSKWSPETSVWAPWAKPVLFAHLNPDLITPIELKIPSELPWLPPVENRTAVIIDLPGGESVAAGLALAAHGYRPVPLYNAVPMPIALPPDIGDRPGVAINLISLMGTLMAGAEILAGMNIAPTAPPVFLLDARRRGEEVKIHADLFDNRSICFPTDFPSANFLFSQGIEKVLLIQPSNSEPQSDLAHVLRRWQDGGISLLRAGLDQPMVEPFQVAKPSWYGWMFQRTWAIFRVRLRPAARGGFGNWMHSSSSGG